MPANRAMAVKTRMAFKSIGRLEPLVDPLGRLICCHDQNGDHRQANQDCQHIFLRKNPAEHRPVSGYR